MKIKGYIYSLLVAFCLVSCDPQSSVDPSSGVQCFVGLSVTGVELNGGSDLIGVQVYEKENSGVTPYAYGLFDAKDKMSLSGYTNKTYRVVATVVVDGKSKINLSDGVYGRPFETTLLNEFVYCTDELSALSASTATLSDGAMCVTPNIDRYYCDLTAKIKTTTDDVELALKRVSFGVSVEGVEADDQITLKITGAPDVETRAEEVSYFTLNYIAEAYAAGDDYSENINTEILRNGLSIYNGNIVYKRNQLTVITIDKNGIDFGFDFEMPFEDDEDDITPPSENSVAYVTKVLDYRPAPGQFVNTMPEYEDGDTQEDMNAKVLDAFADGGVVALGGYGGYVVVGFDHTIENIEGERDFRVLGNAFYSEADEIPAGGSCEAGIIVVAYDKNKNGVPDDDEWYEIAGSSHKDVTSEPFYDFAKENGNDVNFYSDYELTYVLPDGDPEIKDYATYISWSDNKGGSGFVPKNTYHRQPYFPQWIDCSEYVVRGSRLPQNAVDTSGNGTNYVLCKFLYGYADNDTNSADGSAIDISWAVDKDGCKVNLPGVDFVKVYTGIHQINGWIGECSTEVSGVVDLHLL